MMQNENTNAIYEKLRSAIHKNVRMAERDLGLQKDLDVFSWEAGQYRRRLAEAQAQTKESYRKRGIFCV